GLAVPGVSSTARIDEPGMTHMLRDPGVGEWLDRVRLAIIEPPRQQAMTLIERGTPPLRIVVATGAEQIRCTPPGALQPDGSSEANEQPHGAVPMCRILLHPSLEVLLRLQFEPPLRGAAQDCSLIPFCIFIDNIYTTLKRRAAGADRHAPDHHVAGMGPLP